MTGVEEEPGKLPAIIHKQTEPCWLAVQLLEMHRVLADDGSLYLHMDDTAGAWGKCLLDAIFGRANFRNAVIWKRTRRGFKGSQFKAKRYNSNTDTIS